MIVQTLLFSFFQFNKSRVSNEKLIKAEVNIAIKDSKLEIENYFKENILRFNHILVWFVSLPTKSDEFALRQTLRSW